MHYFESKGARRQLVAIHIMRIHVGRRRQLDAEELQAPLLHHTENRHVICVQIEGDAHPLPNRLRPKDMVEVGMSGNRGHQGQVVARHRLEDLFGLVARIDDYRLPAFGVANHVAVALQGSDYEMFEDRERHQLTLTSPGRSPSRVLARVLMSSSVEVEMSIHMSAPPQRVWPYLVDWEGLGRWMKEASDFKVTSAHREGVGVTAEATIRIAGISTTDPVRVTIWEPGELLGLEHLGWVKGVGVMTLTEQKGGTLLNWHESFVAPWGWLGALGLRLWKPLMKRIFQRDLVLLRKLVEQDS